jgi:hypothetical protein
LAEWTLPSPISHQLPVKPTEARRGVARLRAGELTDHAPNEDLVYGEVALWGDVIEHEEGYRASHAKIRSLGLVIIRNTYWGEAERSLREIYGVGRVRSKLGRPVKLTVPPLAGLCRWPFAESQGP